jgi:hypothetical protein
MRGKLHKRDAPDSVLFGQKPRFDSAQRSRYVLNMIELTIDQERDTFSTHRTLDPLNVHLLF